MRIYSMTATFGKLEHETLTLQPGLNVIQAPNEWGKSTWSAFLVAMLYGIETRAHSTKTVLADKERYAPWSGTPMSGRIELNWNGRDITIQRQSKGRTAFGVFRAYETQSGLEVPELTADNCGQQLLGVEKNVFLRAGFLKLTDLPVTEDKALWRRLQQLVTTGDESGAADALDQKLRDLKNRCRANRANGLIPQALAQQQQLRDTLQQLQQLQEQTRRIHNRQEDLKEHTQKLENHRLILEYEAAQAQLRKAAAAEQHLQEAQGRVRQLQDRCAQLPPADSIYQALQRLQQLREQREALQMEVQMQPGAPEVPEIPLPFRGCDPQQALEQAQADTQQYQLCSSQKKPFSTWLFILGLCLTGTGLVSLALLAMKLIPVALLAVGVIATVCGLVYHNNRQRSYQNTKAAAKAIADRYRPLPVGQWEQAAKEYAYQQASYQQAMEVYARNLSHIKTDMQQVLLQLEQLTGGVPHLQWEQQQRSALDCHKELADALRELRQTQAMAQALDQKIPAPPRPDIVDPFRYSAAETARLLSDAEAERHQLQLQLGRCHGQMDALGQREHLQQQLDGVTARLEKLQLTYEALELAQQTLADAAAQLQRRFAPRIAQRAQELFGRLTDSRYDRFTLGADLSVMVSAQPEDTLRSSLWRSDGTVDQLYLALRLAVAEELTPQAPMILDDALVRFDDQRLSRALQILREEAADKQVILFTCQSRETRLLDEISDIE